MSQKLGGFFPVGNEQVCQNAVGNSEVSLGERCQVLSQGFCAVSFRGGKLRRYVDRTEHSWSQFEEARRNLPGRGCVLGFGAGHNRDDCVSEFVDETCAKVCEPQGAAALATVVVRLAADYTRLRAHIAVFGGTRRVVNRAAMSITASDLETLNLGPANAVDCCEPMTATGSVF